MAGTLACDTIQNGAGSTVPTTTVIAGSAKAYGRFFFNGSTITNIGSFNISSITYVSSGLFLITMTTSQPNANYSIVGASGDPTNVGSGCWFTYGYNLNSGGFTPTTTQFRVQIYYTTSNLAGLSDVSFAIFGS